MYNQESVLENETHEILWDFEIRTDHLNPVGFADLVIIYKSRKENLGYRVLWRPRGPQSKSKRIRKREIRLDLARELKKTMEREGRGDTTSNFCARYNAQRIGKRTGGLTIRKRLEATRTTALLKSAKEIPEDLRRLVVIQTSVDNHQLMLV